MILFAFLNAILSGIGVVLQRKGLKNIKKGYLEMLKSKWWLSGTFFIILSTLSYIIAIIDEPIVLVIPISTLSLVVSTMLGIFLLNEKVNIVEIFGMGFLIIGIIILVGM
ncbi:MAG: hypothetical protein J7K73_00570 [Nanoarchaeota archaeon]|nr:hypothetical protein [Nanoarchaeota archaeon]